MSWRRARQLGITERAAHRIIAELDAAGYITRQRNARRNHYTINAHLPLPDAIACKQNIGELLEILTRNMRVPATADQTITIA